MFCFPSLRAAAPAASRLDPSKAAETSTRGVFVYSSSGPFCCCSQLPSREGRIRNAASFFSLTLTSPRISALTFHPHLIKQARCALGNRSDKEFVLRLLSIKLLPNFRAGSGILWPSVSTWSVGVSCHHHFITGGRKKTKRVWVMRRQSYEKNFIRFRTVQWLYTHNFALRCTFTLHSNK